MKIWYTENGKRKEVELNEGELWKNIKTNSNTLNTIFKNLDNGNGKIDKVEIDALFTVMKNNNKDYAVNNITQAELNALKKQDFSKYVGIEIGKLVYEDITAKNRYNMPTTGKNISQHINLITPKNAVAVADAYLQKSNGKQTIAGAILEEYGLSFEERESYIKHIIDALIPAGNQKLMEDQAFKVRKELKKQKNKIGPASSSNLDELFTQLVNLARNTQPTQQPVTKVNKTNQSKMTPKAKTEAMGFNGKIDKDFNQGHEGDCWLIASIKAIALNSKGLNILNNSIKVLDNGKIQVTLKGPNKTYVFTPEEIQNRSELVEGDLDVRAIEMAVEKYLEENPKFLRSKDLDGGVPDVAYDILLGTGGRNFIGRCWGWVVDLYFTDAQIDNFNSPNHIAVVGVDHKHNKKTYYDTKLKRNVKLYAPHGYAVKGSDKDYVYLIDPNYTTVTLSVPRDVFRSYFNRIDEIDL